jgi:hypothetical protein
LGAFLARSYVLKAGIRATSIALGLAACHAETKIGNDNGDTGVVAWSPDSPKPLMLAVVTTPLRSGVRIEGSTNLPDGTGLMARVQRGPVWTDTKFAVQTGHFRVELYPRQGQPIPSGAYDVEVSSPWVDLQPESVKVALGPNYEAVTGPLLVRDELGGRSIEYTTKANVGGRADPAADKAARKRTYREFEANSRRSCEQLPANIEQFTGRRKKPSERTAIIQSCLREVPKSKKELIAEGLIER